MIVLKQKDNIFFTTRKVKGMYSFMLEAMKRHAEDDLKKKLNYLEYSYNSKFSLKLIYHLLRTIFKTNFLENHKFSKYKLYNCELGRHVVANSYTSYNSGICEGINKAAKLATYNYFLYAHDDFYFCPEWDLVLLNEIKKIGHINFYLSGTMMNEGQIKFDCGNTLNEFNEKKFLTKYKNLNYYDFQGSTWAPSIVHKEIWNKVGGLSEEFFPGNGSDPDFNMKLWNIGVRIFKGINDFKVYHFGSVVLRKKLNIIKSKNKYGSQGSKLFLL